MQDRPAASAPINIRISPSKIAADLNSIDSILILYEGVEETYDKCRIMGILCPNIEYLAIGRIKTLISQLKESMEMDTPRDPRSDLNAIQELFEYGDTPSKILSINIDTLKRWCKYWLVPRFIHYDKLNGTNTLLQLMIIIDPQVAEREKQASQYEEAAAVAEAAAAEAADDSSDIFRGFGGKKKYLRLKRSSSSHRNKSHRKNKRRRVFRFKKSYKNKKYIK